MSNSPLFASYGQFNQQYIQIADIDSSGTTDLLYIGSEGVDLYLNQSGNSLNDRKRLSITPNTDLSHIEAIDLLGNGTTSLVWFSALPGDTKTSVKYVDLMKSQKPHLLIQKVNNLGAETRIRYAPSTKFYLDDKEAGYTWLTRLPFLVQCVEIVEVFDQISKNRFTNHFSYHHGYFDGYEREFRGFGIVEKWDTDQFTTTPSTREACINEDGSWSLPPVYTTTWYYTGAPLDEDAHEKPYCHEYFFMSCPDEPEQLVNFNIRGSSLPSGLNYEETRESSHALAGHVIRQEIYGQDGSAKSTVPYVWTENNYSIENSHCRPDSHCHSIITINPR